MTTAETNWSRAAKRLIVFLWRRKNRRASKARDRAVRNVADIEDFYMFSNYGTGKDDSLLSGQSQILIYDQSSSKNTSVIGYKLLDFFIFFDYFES